MFRLTRSLCPFPRDLIALDALLFNLFKLALELPLAFKPFLSTPNIQHFTIQLFPIHFLNCLEKAKQDTGKWLVNKVALISFNRGQELHLFVSFFIYK